MQAFVDQSAIAAARDAFLSCGVESPHVRAETLRAWKRSLAAGAGVTAEPSPSRAIDPESALLRAVAPVAKAMIHWLGTADFAMVVIDNQARVTGRWATNHSVAALLDALGTVVGASFDEAYVGSTGLGTVLEDRAIAIVDGAEHLNHRFDAVLAVGAPIIHPGTGRTEGALDLVCPTGIRPETLVALVQRAARDAGDSLLSGYAAKDRALLDAFLQLERRGPRRPVLALNGRIMMTNPLAGSLIAGCPHEMLWRDVQTALAVGDSRLELTTDTGTLIAAQLRPITGEGNTSGALLQLSTPRTAYARRSPDPVPDTAADIAAEILHLLPGRSSLWRAAVQAVADAAVQGGRLLLLGAAGCGKSALAAAMVDVVPRHIAVPAGSIWRQPLGDIDCRGGYERTELSDRSGDDPWHLTVTTTRGSSVGGLDGLLLTRFDHIVKVPDLGHRLDDVGDIAPAIVARLTDNAAHLAPDALRDLTRRQWRGGVHQLERVLSVAVARAPTTSIRCGDLPAELGAAPPRIKLTYLESVEREAIAALLASTGGNKRRVADILGVSRSTLYRKLAGLHLD